MTDKKPNILVTNDDGIDSPGIYALVKALKRIGNVFVVAPDRQQSAVGHALSVSQPLRVTKFHRNGEMFGYAVTGTPSDCVKIAISSLIKEKLDLVVSGINHGSNTSINVLYSGTVSAATEGMLGGIQSMAISMADYTWDGDCTPSAEYAVVIAQKLLESPLPAGTILNVNVPALPLGQIKGIRSTQLSNSVWNDSYDKRTDPFGRDYYWFAGEYKIFDKSENSDDGAVLAGYVALTPMRFDFTDTKSMPITAEFEKIGRIE